MKDASDPSFTLASEAAADGQPARPIGLRILAHPDLSRIGEQAVLFGPREVGEITIARHAPTFLDAQGNERGALTTRHVSRAGLRLQRSAEGAVLLKPQGALAKLTVDGHGCDEELLLGVEQLRRGLVLTLGRAVALYLSECDTRLVPSTPALLGASPAAQRLKRELALLATLDVPVLLVGGPGSGKQLAARTMHGLSARRAEAFVFVRAASWRASLPVTDAAGKGSLFVADLAELDQDGQRALHLALDAEETGAQPSGARVRILAGTERDPDQPDHACPLRRTLVDRFARRVRIPALHERREDIPLLFAAFLSAAMKAHGAEARLYARDPAAPGFLPASLPGALIESEWPGNVRQLRNFAEAFALANQSASEPEIEEWLAANLPVAAPRADEVSESAAPRPASELSDDEIREALRRTRYNITHAAELLSVSKAWLHVRIERSALLPRAKDLSEAEIERALSEAGRDVTRAAELLLVSKHGLRLRMRALGMGLPATRSLS